MFFSRRYSLNDLKKYRKDENDRHAFKILIIDDEDIVYEDELRIHGYNHRHVRDIDSIDYVSEYNIVICDIKGVGKRFNSQYEGAHIISEIDKKYPNKIKIAYTGQHFSINYNKFFEMCDNTIHKDADFEEWIEALDSSIAKVSDPIIQWKKVRERLLNNDVEMHDVYLLEQDYIRSICDGKESIISSSKGLNNLNADMKNIVLGLVSSGIFRMFTGS